MKNRFKIIGLILITVSIILPSLSFAQSKIELTPFVGYQFGGKMRFYEGELKVQDDLNYGLLVDIALAPDTYLEIYWSQMQTSAKFTPYYGYSYLDYLSEPFDININYIQIGGVQEVDIDNDMIKPFGAFTLGTTYFSPQENGYQDSWQFSVTLGGGAKIWFSDRVGIRLQGRLLMPLYFAGGGVYFGTGGSGLSVGAGSTILQGDFTAGLMIGLGDL